MFDNHVVVVCEFVRDLQGFFDDENELVSAAVLQGAMSTKGKHLRTSIYLVFLCLDEIVERWMILETDANVIAGKVATNSMDPNAPLSEQTITQALAATAREHLTRTLFHL